jgi:hypothetical protein
MEGVGVPISGLKQLIAMKTADRSKPGVQSGVPRFFDNQLHEWIYNSVLQILKLTKKLQIAIKGDAKKNIQQSNWLWIQKQKSITSILLLV